MMGRGTEKGPIYGTSSDLYFKEGVIDVLTFMLQAIYNFIAFKG